MMVLRAHRNGNRTHIDFYYLKDHFTFNAILIN